VQVQTIDGIAGVKLGVGVDERVTLFAAFGADIKRAYAGQRLNAPLREDDIVTALVGGHKVNQPRLDRLDEWAGDHVLLMQDARKRVGSGLIRLEAGGQCGVHGHLLDLFDVGDNRLGRAVELAVRLDLGANLVGAADLEARVSVARSEPLDDMPAIDGAEAVEHGTVGQALHRLDEDLARDVIPRRAQVLSGSGSRSDRRERSSADQRADRARSAHFVVKLVRGRRARSDFLRDAMAACDCVSLLDGVKLSRLNHRGDVATAVVRAAAGAGAVPALGIEAARVALVVLGIGALDDLAREDLVAVGAAGEAAVVTDAVDARAPVTSRKPSASCTSEAVAKIT
jgi:hypothetical protein